MGHVRAFDEADIPAVTALHRRVFPLPDGREAPAEAYHTYLREIFLANPWCPADPPSLVYEDGGDIVGFVGVVCRPMILQDRPVRMATSSQFIVEPDHRTTLAAIELVRAVLAGPQDFTLADEAIDLSRRLWEGLGGATVSLYSLSWVRVLRPCGFAVKRWGVGGPIDGTWRAASRLADAIVTRLPGSPFRAPVPVLPAEELDGEALATCLAQCMKDRILRPAYDDGAAEWILGILARKPGGGTLRKALVRTAEGEIAGWYIYAGARGGLGEVIQLGARPGMIDTVIDHLWAQAWRDGLVALVGRLDPQYFVDLAARHCFFHHRGYWTLVHARDPRLLETLNQGNAFLTRLEGEWCLRFQAGLA